MENFEQISLLLHVMAERITELIPECQINQNLIEDPNEIKSSFDYCSKIKISESLHGEFILTISKDALKLILENVFFFDIAENEDEDLIYNGVCEFLNLIAANSTRYMENIEMPIEIGIPEIVKPDQKIDNKEAIPAMEVFPTYGKILLMFNEI